MIQWNKLTIDWKEYVVGIITTDATPTILTTNQSPVSGATNQIVVPAGSGMAFIAEVVGLSGATVFRQRIKGTVKTAGGTTALVGANVVSDKWTDSGASTWSAVASADNPNKCLTITVNGQAATNINWFAVINTMEVS